MNTKLIALLVAIIVLFLISPLIFEYRNREVEIDDRPEYVKEEEFIGNYIANNSPTSNKPTE